MTARKPLDLTFTPPTPPTDPREKAAAELIAFMRDEVEPGLDLVRSLWETAMNGHVMDAVKLGKVASQLRGRIDTELPKAQWLYDVSFAHSVSSEYQVNEVAKSTHRAKRTAKLIELDATADVAYLQQLVSRLKNHQAGLVRDANFAQSLMNVYRDRIVQTELESGS